MNVAILAGGRGALLVEETEVRPIPKTAISDRTILWHIMRHYDDFSHRDVVISRSQGRLCRRYLTG